MISVRVHHVAAMRILGDGNEGDAWPAAEEVEGLEEARVPVATALVEGDEEGRLCEECRMCLELVEDLGDQRFKQIELRACRMAIDEAIGLHIGDGRQVAVLEIVKEIAHVLDVRLALSVIAHD